MPDLDEAMAPATCAPLIGWLREHVHGQGARLGFQDLLRLATGKPLDPEDFTDHLRSRYLQRAAADQPVGHFRARVALARDRAPRRMADTSTPADHDPRRRAHRGAAAGGAARKLRCRRWPATLVAGSLIGPHTPGFVGNLALAGELLEIGIILLMFGVGLHFSAAGTGARRAASRCRAR